MTQFCIINHCLFLFIIFAMHWKDYLNSVMLLEQCNVWLGTYHWDSHDGNCLGCICYIIQKCMSHKNACHRLVGKSYNLQMTATLSGMALALVFKELVSDKIRNYMSTFIIYWIFEVDKRLRPWRFPDMRQQYLSQLLYEYYCTVVWSCLQRVMIMHISWFGSPMLFNALINITL